MIDLIHISKTYQTGKISVNALDNLNFSVKEGDFIIIKGPSGSGKSTLLNILSLLDEPTSGTVKLQGTEITYNDFDALANMRSQIISFIFQAFNLNPVLTLEENVMVPLMIRKDIEKSERKRRVDEWIDLTGLNQHRHHRPDELSGGQRQRVAIARAMVTNPKLVIADEPTANLDSKTASNILALMKKLNTERKVAFIFATHDSLLENYANDIRLLKDGQLSTRN